MSIRKRGLWILLAGVALPALVIGVATLTSSSRPRVAVAAVAAEPGTDPKGPSPADSQEAARAQAAVKGMSKDVPASPFESSPALTNPTPTKTPTNQDGLRLTGVFSANNAAMAAINGKIYRVGQEISPGVSIESIDAGSRRVTVVFQDGRKVTLEVNRGKAGSNTIENRKRVPIGS